MQRMRGPPKQGGVGGARPRDAAVAGPRRGQRGQHARGVARVQVVLSKALEASRRLAWRKGEVHIAEQGASSSWAEGGGHCEAVGSGEDSV